jgi:hypothetical protein
LFWTTTTFPLSALEFYKLEFIPYFIKIKKKFASHRASRVLRKTECLLLDVYIAETRGKLFQMRSSIEELQGLIFNSIVHNKFQNLEIFITQAVTHVNNKQKHRHDKILNNARNSLLFTNSPAVNELKLVCNISDVTLTDIQQRALSKGLNFGITPKSIPKFEIVKAIESFRTYCLEHIV